MSSSYDQLKMLQGASKLTQIVERHNSLLARAAIGNPTIEEIINNGRRLSYIAEEVSQLIKQTQLIEMNKLAQPLAFQSVCAVTNNLAELLQESRISAIVSLIKKYGSPSNPWKDFLSDVGQVVKQIPSLGLMVQAHLTQIAQYSILSQVTLCRLPWDQLGGLLDISAYRRKSLQDAIVGMARSYSKLFESFEDDTNNLLSLPPVLSRLPAVEFFNSIDVADVITIEPSKGTEFTEFEERLRQDREETRKQIKEEAGDRLEALLAELGNDLPRLLQGARLAFNSSNPDHVRHVAVSYRELFTYVIHRLAPDDQIRQWSTDPKHYDDKGRPTRKARLLFICQPVNQDKFSDFIKTDIKAGLEALNLLQYAIHSIHPKLTIPQLAVIQIRIESMIRTLLEIRYGL